jgi:hypothetical protein
MKTFLVTTEGGVWEAQAEFGGNDCFGPSISIGEVTVPLPERDYPEAEAPPSIDRLSITSLSKNAKGEISGIKGFGQTSNCKVMSYEVISTLALDSAADADAPDVAQWDGELYLPDLRYLISLDQSGAGLARGRFRWTSKDKKSIAVGRIDGIANAGTRRKPVSRAKECGLMQNHQEWTLIGTVIEGPNAGARLRATALIKVTGYATGATVIPSAFSGTIEGALEENCDLSEVKRDKRIALAKKGWQTIEQPCTVMPCLWRSGGKGTGRLTLDAYAKKHLRREFAAHAKNLEPPRGSTQARLLFAFGQVAISRRTV